MPPLPGSLPWVAVCSLTILATAHHRCSETICWIQVTSSYHYMSLCLSALKPIQNTVVSLFQGWLPLSPSALPGDIVSVWDMMGEWVKEWIPGHRSPGHQGKWGMISKPDSRRGACRPAVAARGFLDLSLFLSVPAQGCCCLVVQRRMLQASACEYEPACAPCSSSPGLQGSRGHRPGSAHALDWFSRDAGELGTGLGTQGLRVLIWPWPLTLCATLVKSINPS